MGKMIQRIKPYRYLIALTGPKGGGKTQVTYQIADAFADSGRDVAITSLEQGGLDSEDTQAARDRNVQTKNFHKIHITGDAPKGIDTIKAIEKIKDFDKILGVGKITETSYVDKSNRNSKMYLLDRDIFAEIVMGFHGDNATDWKREYIKAFNKMENAIRELQDKLLPDPQTYGTLNEKTGAARTKIVRGYYRSDKNDKLSRLVGERLRLEKRLGGFFDEEIQLQIDALRAEIDVVSRDVSIEYKHRQILQKGYLNRLNKK